MKKDTAVGIICGTVAFIAIMALAIWQFPLGL